MNKIILVDDHSLFREGIKLLIENEGIGEIVAEAENGEVFLQKLQVIQPDLVIMDIEMPVMNGLEATKKALALYPDLKILILTMLNEKSNYIELVNAGALGFVLKTSGKIEFEKAINAIAEGGNYFSNDILKLIIQQNKITASSPESDSVSTISGRENNVLQLICQGFTVSEIAEKLFLSVKTIESHRSALLKKTNTKNTINLVIYAIKYKLVEI